MVVVVRALDEMVVVSLETLVIIVFSNCTGNEELFSYVTCLVRRRLSTKGQNLVHLEIIRGQTVVARKRRSARFCY